jgi:hypothetical protein
VVHLTCYISQNEKLQFGLKPSRLRLLVLIPHATYILAVTGGQLTCYTSENEKLQFGLKLSYLRLFTFIPYATYILVITSGPPDL